MKKLIVITAILIMGCKASQALADPAEWDAAYASFKTTQAFHSATCLQLADPVVETAAGLAKIIKIAHACAWVVSNELNPSQDNSGPNFALAFQAAKFPLLMQLDACDWLKQHSPSRYLTVRQYCGE